MTSGLQRAADSRSLTVCCFRALWMLPGQGGNWETCTVLEGIVVALSSFSSGVHLWKGSLSEEAEIVLGWFGCFCLTWTIVSLLWSIESPGPNLWVLFSCCYHTGLFYLFMVCLLIFTSLFKCFVYIFLNFFITPCMFLLAVSNSVQG